MSEWTIALGLFLLVLLPRLLQGQPRIDTDDDAVEPRRRNSSRKIRLSRPDRSLWHPGTTAALKTGD